MATTIQISDELWKYLNKQRNLGETFDLLLKRLLKTKLRNKKLKGGSENGRKEKI